MRSGSLARSLRKRQRVAFREYGLQPFRYGPRKSGPSGYFLASSLVSSSIAGVR